MTEEMFGGPHRIDEQTRAEPSVRVNTDETTETASDQSVQLRECIVVQEESKKSKEKMLDPGWRR
jgi:hypothetical protein